MLQGHILAACHPTVHFSRSSISSALPWTSCPRPCRTMPHDRRFAGRYGKSVIVPSSNGLSTSREISSGVSQGYLSTCPRLRFADTARTAAWTEIAPRCPRSPPASLMDRPVVRTSSTSRTDRPLNSEHGQSPPLCRPRRIPNSRLLAFSRSVRERPACGTPAAFLRGCT